MADATDNDLIRRGDALAIFRPENSMAKRRICDDIRALSAQIAPTADVAGLVKPLEWDHDGRKLRLDDTMHMSKGYDWDAYECLRQEGYGLDCGYIIWPDGFAGKAWNLYGTHDGLYIQGLADESAAKAAAQADYEARILSAVTIQPAAQVQAEAVAVVTPDRATFDAMCAMRDAINEYVPMPSLESDLLQGPENSVFCAVVAEAVIGEIIRIRAIQPAAPAVVKPLDWHNFDAWTHWAEGACGTYHVEERNGYWQVELRVGGLIHGVTETDDTTPADLDAAKAAAQADYAARILSALTIQPSAQAVAEAVAEERRRIIAGLLHEANNLPCEEDAKVAASLADLVASGFSYEAQEEAGAFLDSLKAEAVAVAYVAALNEADTLLQKWVDRDWTEEMERAALNTASGISDRILALTPADATAALARRDAETRKAALREGLATALMEIKGVPMYSPPSEEFQRGMAAAYGAIAQRLALIEERRHG